MTRETKIGLLVGLAFIIVIGILLSDHLTSSTEPPPAQLAPAGSVVRAGVTTPGGAQPRMAQVVAPRVQPQNTVPTARDVQQPTAPAAVVRVGGPSGQDQAQPDSQPAPPITFVTNPTPGQPMQQPGLDPAHAALAQVAQHNGESIVSATRDPGRQVVVAAAAPGFKDYVAQPGDSLSKIASQQMGSKNQANQDAIVRANPSLTSNPNLIIAGKTYKIPVTAAAPSESAPVAAIATSPARETASATDFWYTVKDGDTLWGIANEQLGGPSGVTAIKELNRDLLKDSDTIRVNMKLRLPGRPIARVN